MRIRKIFAFFLALLLLFSLCPGVGAAGDLFFIAVNDAIPLTLSDLPIQSGSGLYVPYNVFDAAPGGVVPSYNQANETFVLFTRARRLVFDLKTGTVTDENENTAEVSTLFNNGILYVPLVYCASHFGLRISFLNSKDGYEVLRFTTGSEVYDDALFIEKAENLIANRVLQYGSGQIGNGTSQPGIDTPGQIQLPGEIDPENPPATIYLAFIDAQTMADSLSLLKSYKLRGAFFFTEQEILAYPDLVRTVYAAGHPIGLRIDDPQSDAQTALAQANDALDAVLQRKTVMALLDSSQSQDISGYRIFTMPQASLSAEQAVADPQAPHLLVCSNDASYVLSTIYEAGASAKLLQETALVD